MPVLQQVQPMVTMKSNTQNLPKCEECAIRNSALFGELETEQLDKARGDIIFIEFVHFISFHNFYKISR